MRFCRKRCRENEVHSERSGITLRSRIALVGIRKDQLTSYSWVTLAVVDADDLHWPACYVVARVVWKYRNRLKGLSVIDVIRDDRPVWYWLRELGTQPDGTGVRL